MAEVSIIVPVYNTAKYLPKCVDSIINQTFKDIEIILINDGSTDNSLEILSKYISDNRVKIITKENGGLSSARNKGIEIATAKYLMFLDSDDWVKNNFVECAYSRIEKDRTDMAIFNMVYTYSNGEEKYISKITEDKVLNLDEAIKELLKVKTFECHAVNKIYKKKLFEDIKFPVGEIYEDIAIFYKLLLKAKRVSLINETLYYYLQKREGSILNEHFTESKFKIMEHVELTGKEIGEKYEVKYKEYYLIYLVSLIISLSRGYNDLNLEDKTKYLNIMKKYLSKVTLFEIITNSNETAYRKIILALSRINLKFSVEFFSKMVK